MKTNEQKTYVRLSILNSQDDRVEFHQDPELFYILEGSMDISVSGHKSVLRQQDIFVINANEEYQYHASDDVLFVRLTIPCQLISNIMQTVDIVFRCNTTCRENGHYSELRDSLRKLLNRYIGVREHGEDFGYYTTYYNILDLLTTHFLIKITDREDLSGKGLFDERIVRINNYINANYGSQISIKTLSQQIYLSQGYLSRFFKKNYGMTFSDYLTKVRLYHAMDQMIYTEIPITRIAFECGFPNSVAFNKAFKEQYKDTPSKMRKQLKKKNEDIIQREKKQLLNRRLEEHLERDGTLHEDEKNPSYVAASINIGNSVSLLNIWGDTINIGAAADLLRFEVREHILILAQEFKFKYIRFWNIFSEEMLIDLNANQGRYNFSKLDKILDFLVENGLKPHIELGMKPRRLYKNVQNAIIEEKSDSSGIDLADWGAFLRAMMNHLVRCYRRMEINTWRMELWMDESLWGDETAVGIYYELFNTSYTIVKQFADQMEIGGCGLRLDYTETDDFGKQFLQKWRMQPCQPDFISVIYYAYERSEIRNDRYSKRITDNDDFLHRMKRIRELLSEVDLGKIKLYVTEWNLTISDRNYINDSCFKGAYIIKNVLDLYGQMDLLSYFCGTDWVSEHYDSYGLLHGGTGLLTKDGIFKPAAYAFMFLNRLFPYYVSKGDNYMITTDRHNSYTIICHNQKALNYNYYLAREDTINREHIWNYFENRETMQISLHLEGVQKGTYQIKTQQINEQYGDVLEIWGEMGYESELTRDDIKYLQRVCGSKIRIQSLKVDGDTMHIDINLMPNEIRLLRIRKL